MASPTESNQNPPPHVIYKELNPDDPDQEPTEMESMCPSCEQNGTTKLLLTRIPFYKEVILMSFSCDHCGYRNNELQSGTKVQEKGVRLICKIEDTEDLNRQVIKSEYAAVRIPEVDLEIPAKSQAGEITTVEGIIRRCMETLTASQHLRESSTQFAQVAEFLPKLTALLSLANGPFTLIVDDAGGDSFIENPHPEKIDTKLKIVRYERTMEQNKLLALVDDDAVEEETSGAAQGNGSNTEDLKNEVMHFGTDCSNCGAPTATNMKIVDIPHFKEVILMATTCDACGHKTTNVQPAKGIGAQACRLSLYVSETSDLSRDVLKSDTCAMSIPELDMQVGMGALSGRFTTVEGLLNATKEQLSNDTCLLWGDSADPNKRQKLTEFLSRLDDILALKLQAHLVLDDAAGNSYIQRLPDSNGADERLTVEFYDRTDEQNDDLGLKDINVDNYAES